MTAQDQDDTQTVPGSTATDVVDVVEPLRRYVRAHTFQSADADDVVQETLTRLLELGRPLAPHAAVAYALVTARHLIANEARTADRNRRHAHRLVDLTEPSRPDQGVVDDEERRALRHALAAVPDQQRELLLAHVLEGRPLIAIAAGAGRSDGALASQLARTGARLRLDYVLALRGTTLLTPRCRPVLMALSAGQTRRQEALRAGEHLLTCPTCAELSRPLLQRRRALAAVLPWLGVGPVLLLLRRLLSQRPVQIGSAVTALVAAGAVTSAMLTSATTASTSLSSPTPAAPTRTVSTPAAQAPSGVRTVTVVPDGQLTRRDDGRSLTSLRDAAGVAVSGRRMRVVSVPADEGFWVEDGRDQIWVQLGINGESRLHVAAGDTVTFTGRVVAHGPTFAGQVGVSTPEGATRLTQQAAHVSVPASDLHAS